MITLDSVTSYFLKIGQNYLVAKIVKSKDIGSVFYFYDIKKPEDKSPVYAINRRDSIENIKYNIRGMTARLEWDRAANASIAILGPDTGEFDYRREGGIVDPGEEGDRTGNIILTSVYADTGDSYDITLTVKLK